MFQSSVTTRLFLGTLLVLAFAGVLVLEGWLSGHNYFISGLQATGLGVMVILGLLLTGAMLELHRLGKNAPLPMLFSRPIAAIGILALVFEPMAASNFSLAYTETLPFLVFMIFAAAALVHGLTLRFSQAIQRLSWGSFVLIYLGVTGWFIVKIRMLGMTSGGIIEQIGPLAFFLTTVKSTDIGAYLLGRAFGTHKWVPSISPGKSWEGLVGGIVVSCITASLLAKAFGIMSFYRAMGFGILMAVIGQLGDLLESMLKRDAGCKDSAGLLPEFGGILDALDSLLIAAPFAYALLIFWGHRI